MLGQKPFNSVTSVCRSQESGALRLLWRRPSCSDNVPLLARELPDLRQRGSYQHRVLPSHHRRVAGQIHHVCGGRHRHRHEQESPSRWKVRVRAGMVNNTFLSFTSDSFFEFELSTARHYVRSKFASRVEIELQPRIIPHGWAIPYS